MLLLSGDLQDGSCIFRLLDPEGDAAITAGLGVERIIFGPGHRVEGVGRIRQTAEMHGTLSPGFPIDNFELEYPFELTETGRLEIEVQKISNDTLSSDSVIALGGTLDILFSDGFEPTAFWKREIISAESITGHFDHILIPSFQNGLTSRTYNSGTQLYIGQSCLADLDLDGDVNFSDISLFISMFRASHPETDFNKDGLFNFLDISIFIASVGTGGP